MSSEYGFDEEKYIVRISKKNEGDILHSVWSDKGIVKGLLKDQQNSFSKSKIIEIKRRIYLRLKYLGRSEDFISRELSDLEVKPYTPPSREGTRNLNIRLDEETFRAFKELSDSLSAKNEFLFYKALEQLFDHYGRTVPESVRRRLSEPKPRRPGPKLGSKQGPRLKRGD